MSLKRIFSLIIIFIVLALYFPINHFAKGGIQLLLPFDKLVPFFPPAITVYLLGSILFVVFPIWAAWKVKPYDFEPYFISVIFAAMVSYVVYLVFPTFVNRPEITSQDIFSKAIIWLYQTDRAYNAAPSGHTFNTLIFFLYMQKWNPKYKYLWLILAILIILSTVLVKQHYILDVLSGLVLGGVSYIIGLSVQKKFKLKLSTED